MPADAVLLFEDETLVRLFPVLRRAWSLSGESTAVSISGRNDKRVLFGVINLRTGHRILLNQPAIRQDSFQAFLRLLRHCYCGRPIWLLVDRASAHTAPQSLAVAQALDITLVWLPKQCPELNAMDHLWKTVKSNISANYLFSAIDEHVSFIQDYILNLTNHKALRKAGILSKNFWLKSFFK